MHKILLLACLLLSGISLSAQPMDETNTQPLDGTYKNGADSITFSKERVTFRISGFGGLSSAQAGEGRYELNGDYLLIHTSDYSGKKSSFEPLDGSGSDTCVIHTVGPQHYFIPGILVESRNKSGKVVSAKVSGNDGKIFFTPCGKIASISAAALGYNAISFDYTPGKDYRIKLAENDIIENKTVAFSIALIDEETLSLLMLTDDFKNSKEPEKELQKLKKKAQKNNKLDIRMKKIYIPYDRKH